MIIKDTILNIRVSSTEKITLEKIAKAKGFGTVTNYVRYLLGLSYHTKGNLKI